VSFAAVEECEVDRACDSRFGGVPYFPQVAAEISREFRGRRGGRRAICLATILHTRRQLTCVALAL
jgi:hypothetical protein